MYQKFRLIRERNQLELQQIGYSTKLARIEKNITRKEKYYQGLFTKLEQQATNFKNQAKIGIQNMFGLGQGSVNPLNYAGTNGGIMNIMYHMLQNGVPAYDENAKKFDESSKHEFSKDPTEALQIWAQYGDIPQAREADGTLLWADDEKKTPVYMGDYTATDVLVLKAVYQQANARFQQNQMMASNATTAYDTNVSIWLEAQQAQLQAEQDSVIGALQYEQTIMGIDNTYCEQRLKRIEQEIQSYDKLIDDRTEKNVPKFGLG